MYRCRHLLICLLLAALTPLLAQTTVTWVGSGDGSSWIDAGNWDTESVPGLTDDVVIALDGATVILPDGTPITIASLALGDGTGSQSETIKDGNAIANGINLHVTGSVTIASDGHLLMAGTTYNYGFIQDSLSVGSTITNDGVITLNNGCIITGNITNNGTLKNTKMGGAFRPTIIGTLTNSSSGKVEISSGIDGQMTYLVVTGDLSNAGKLTISTEQYGSETGGHFANLDVSGTLTNQAGATILDTSDTFDQATRTITVDSLNNQGSILAHAQTSYYDFTIYASASAGEGYTNSGHIHIGQSTIINSSGTFTNSGTITIDTTKTLTLNGYSGAGTYTGSGDQFHGNGTLTLTGMTVSAASFPVLDSLSLSLSASSALSLTDSLRIYRTLTVNSSTIEAAGTRNHGTLTLNSSGSIASDIINHGTLVLNGGTITGTVTNNDSLNAGSNAAITGAVTNGANAKLIIANAGATAGLSVDGGITNHGYLELNPVVYDGYTLISVTNGSLTNTGTIQGATGYDGSYSFTLQADLVNAGTFESNFKLYFNGGSHSNSGTFRINQAAAGSYQVMHSQIAFQSGATFTNTGTVFMDTTASLYIVGATYQGAAGTLDGTGTLRISITGGGMRSTGYLGQKFVIKDYGAKLSLTSSTIYVDSLINQTAWTASGDTVYAGSVIINQGKLTLEPYSSSPYSPSAMVGPFINQDTLTTDGSTGYLSGPVVNEAEALISVSSNASGTSTLTVDSSLTNYGKLELKNAVGAAYYANLNVNKGWLTNKPFGVIDGLIYSTVKADLDNQGTFNINPSTYLLMNKNPTNIINSGTIHVQGGDYFQVNNLASFQNSGALTIDAGRTVKLYGSTISEYFPSPEATFTLEGGGSISNAGNLEFCYLSVNTGHKWVVGSAENVMLYLSRVTTDSLINEGYLTMMSSSISGEVVNYDTLVATVYGAAFDSTLVNEAGAYIKGGGTYLKVDSAFTNHGDLEITTILAGSYGATVDVKAGNLVNGPTGSINVVVGVSNSIYLQHKLYTNLVNQGTITLSAPTKLFKADAVHTNSGTLQVDTTLTISGSGTFTNPADGIVSGKGTIDVTDTDVAFTNAGAVNPGGSPGILTFEGDFVQETTGVIKIEIEGDNPGTGYDQLNITGTAALAGSLNVHLAVGHSVLDKTYQVLTYGSFQGVFDAVNGLVTGDGGNFNAHFDESGVYLVGSFTGGASPPFISAIADIIAPEDTTLAVALKAFDPDEGAVLTFSASANTPAVDLAIVQDTLKITPELNWNGTANIEVIVADLAGLKDTTEFALTLTPVQDKPLAFNITLPARDTTVVINQNNLYTTHFVLQWDQAEDPDGQSVSYSVVLTDSLTIMPFKNPYSGTSVQWTLQEIQYAMIANVDTIIGGTLTVLATDGIGTTLAANGPLHLTIIDSTRIILALMEGQGLPTEFALHPAYPNPFNPSTTVRYDLPEATEVTLVIYDLLGREVIQLVEGHQELGYRQVIWNGRTADGHEVPTGIYVARLVTSEYTRSIKLVLLK